MTELSELEAGALTVMTGAVLVLWLVMLALQCRYGGRK